MPSSRCVPLNPRLRDGIPSFSASSIPSRLHKNASPTRPNRLPSSPVMGLVAIPGDSAERRILDVLPVFRIRRSTLKSCKSNATSAIRHATSRDTPIWITASVTNTACRAILMRFSFRFRRNPSTGFLATSHAHSCPSTSQNSSRTGRRGLENPQPTGPLDAARHPAREWNGCDIEMRI